MLIEEQEDVIAMLERLRAKKRYVPGFVVSYPLPFFFLLEKKRGRGVGRGGEKRKIITWRAPRELIIDY
jgi:hypothetical protein